MTVPDEVLVDVVSRYPGCTWWELLLNLDQEGWPNVTRSQLNSRLYRIPSLDWESGIGGYERRWYCKASPDLPRSASALGAKTATISSEEIPLYPWQKEALSEWEDCGYQGVIEAVTGSGKTRVAIAAAERQLRRGGYVVVVVPTIDLIHQWKREIERLLIDTLSMDVSVGILGDKRKDSLDDFNVLIATHRSGSEYVLLPDGANGLLIADEVHRCGAPKYSLVLEPNFDKRLGLTATYERDDTGCEKYLDPYFGGVIFSVDYKRALKDGVIAPFKIAFVAAKFSSGERRSYEEQDRKVRRYKNRLVNEHGLPEEPFGEFMREVNRLKTSGEGQAAFQAGLYLNAFTRRRELLASAQSKYDRLNDLTDAIRGADKTIIFAQTREAAQKAVGRFTKRGVNGAVLTSSMDRVERKQVLAGFEDGKHELVAAPRLLDEGIDVAAADLAVVLATSRSRRQMVQRMGRVLRLKEDGRLARLVVFYVEETAEDPNVSHEDFLGLVTGVACDIQNFSTRASSTEICKYLNALR